MNRKADIGNLIYEDSVRYSIVVPDNHLNRFADVGQQNGFVDVWLKVFASHVSHRSYIDPAATVYYVRIGATVIPSQQEFGRGATSRFASAWVERPIFLSDEPMKPDDKALIMLGKSAFSQLPRETQKSVSDNLAVDHTRFTGVPLKVERGLQDMLDKWRQDIADVVNSSFGQSGEQDVVLASRKAQAGFRSQPFKLETPDKSVSFVIVVDGSFLPDGNLHYGVTVDYRVLLSALPEDQVRAAIESGQDAVVDQQASYGDFVVNDDAGLTLPDLVYDMFAELISQCVDDVAEMVHPSMKRKVKRLLQSDQMAVVSDAVDDAADDLVAWATRAQAQAPKPEELEDWYRQSRKTAQSIFDDEDDDEDLSDAMFFGDYEHEEGELISEEPIRNDKSKEPTDQRSFEQVKRGDLINFIEDDGDVISLGIVMEKSQDGVVVDAEPFTSLGAKEVFVPANRVDLIIPDKPKYRKGETVKVLRYLGHITGYVSEFHDPNVERGVSVKITEIVWSNLGDKWGFGYNGVYEPTGEVVYFDESFVVPTPEDVERWYREGRKTTAQTINKQYDPKMLKVLFSVGGKQCRLQFSYKAMIVGDWSFGASLKVNFAVSLRVGQESTHGTLGHFSAIEYLFSEKPHHLDFDPSQYIVDATTPTILRLMDDGVLSGDPDRHEIIGTAVDMFVDQAVPYVAQYLQDVHTDLISMIFPNALPGIDSSDIVLA